MSTGAITDVPPHDTVLAQVLDDVAIFTLNRPDKRNALDDVIIEQLDELIGAAELDDSIKVVVIAAAGDSFSAGHDITGPEPNMEAGGRKSDNPAYTTAWTGAERRLKREQRIYVDASLRIRNLSKPTVAAVQGHCVAAGLMLASMCDLIVAADDASFADPVVRMGNGSIELLVEPWDLGVRRAKEFLWTGDPITAQEAKQIGFVSRIAPREELHEAALALARRIALSPPVAVSLVKRSLNHTWDLMGQSASFEHHFMVHHIAHNSDESRTIAQEGKSAPGGLRAYLKNRDGKYQQ
ncbi:MAG: enoyl-CoA hydratase [Beutenbergiaceae bacterium]